MTIWLKSLFVVFSLASMVSTVGVCEGQEEYVPLSISIAVPERNGNREILAGHFHVVIKNTSTRPQRVWWPNCSKGYECLSFNVTENERTWTVGRKAAGWDRDPISFYTLQPNDNYVIEVDLTRDGTDSILGKWIDPPIPEEGKTRPVTIQAVFQIKACELSKQSNVWTGRIVSETQNYTMR